jgi:hypothetical protein
MVHTSQASKNTKWFMHVQKFSEMVSFNPNLQKVALLGQKLTQMIFA